MLPTVFNPFASNLNNRGPGAVGMRGLQTASLGQQQSQHMMTQRYRPLQLLATKLPAVEHRISPPDTVGVLNHVADTNVVQNDINGFSAVIDAMFERLLSMQDLDDCAPEPGSPPPLADEINTMQEHPFEGRIKIH